MPGVVSDAARSAKQIAIQAAKQMAKEPLEVVKQAGEQVKGQTLPVGESPSQEAINANITPEEKAKIQVQGQRQIQALETEIKEIRIAKEQKELVEKQQELAQTEVKTETPVPVIASKRSRRFGGFGQKANAEKQQTRVEKPLPPSG